MTDASQEGLAMAGHDDPAGRTARERAPDENTARILRVIEETSRYSHPVGDIGQMLKEIERGSQEPLPE